MIRTYYVSLILGIVLCAGSIADASILYGAKNSFAVDADGIYTVDQTSGALTKLGGDNVAWGNMTSDWRPESPRLWVVQPVQNKVFRVNPSTGAYVLEKEVF